LSRPRRKLLEFNVHAVTEGIDALGEVTVRLQAENGHTTTRTSPQTERPPPHLRRLRRRYRHHRRQRQGLSLGVE
jgi:hypothetical protein